MVMIPTGTTAPPAQALAPTQPAEPYRDTAQPFTDGVRANISFFQSMRNTVGL